MMRLQSAVEGCDREYGRIPDVGALHLTMEGARAGELLKILLGEEEESSGMLNVRQLPFLSAKRGSSKRKGGIIYHSKAPHGPPGFYDRWGEPLELFLRAPDASDLVFHDGKRLVRLPGAVAAVMSKGPDRKRGTRDDLKTWE